MRQLEAVVRIAESFARMQLQPVATEAHVRRALDLFTVSTMDAVKSGVMEAVVSSSSPFRPHTPFVTTVLYTYPWVMANGSPFPFQCSGFETPLMATPAHCQKSGLLRFLTCRDEPVLCRMLHDV